jgi:ankyrin repeat protein
MKRTVISPILLVVGIVVSLVGCAVQNTDQELRDAARTGTLEDVKYWLSRGADDNAKELAGIAGSTPLHEAAGRGDGAMVSLLIAEGADINATDDSGHTPLFRAGNEETLRLLLDAGAELNAQGPNSEKVIEWAETNGFGWKSQILREHVAKIGSES